MVEARSSPRSPALQRAIDTGATIAVVTASTGFAWILFGRQSLPDVAMVFLLGIVVVAMRWSFLSAVLAALLSVLSYDFFFIPPYLSFTVDDGRHVVTFGVMFVVGVVISSLTRRVREQAATAREREERTERLYAMTRELSTTLAVDRLGEVASRHLRGFFERDIALLVADASGRLPPATKGDAARAPSEDDRAAAEWAFSHDEPAGAGTTVHPSAAMRFVPLRGSRGRVGVLGVLAPDPTRFADLERRQVLATFAAPIAGAVERARIAGEADAARLEMEAERLQSSLLSSVSHDLRTPLAVITGAATTLLEPSPELDAAARRDLLAAIYDESVRLTRLVGNLLDMTKLAAGAMRVNKEWQSIEAVVGAALRHADARLVGRPVQVDVASDLPLVSLDAVLLEQVLINLLENAARYSPPGTPIVVRAQERSGEMRIEVCDRGPGVPDAEKPRIFEKFYRAPGAAAGGAGLGLAICRGITEAQGGRIDVEDREGGGAVFRVTLPIEDAPPVVEEDGGAP